MAAHAMDTIRDYLAGLAIDNESNGRTAKVVPNGSLSGKDKSKKEYLQQLEVRMKANRERILEALFLGPDGYDSAWLEALTASNVRNGIAFS